MRNSRSDTHLEMLSKVPLFHACSKKDLKVLAQMCDAVDAPKGKVLCKQGSVGYECFVLVEGTADVEVDGRVVANLKDGAYFGELSLLDKGPRSATVTLTSDSHLLVLGPREFSSALETVPGLANRLLGGLARRLRESNARLAARL